MKALRFSGTPMAVDQVFEKLAEDEVFYRNSGGGVTLSGGECTMHYEFVIKLLTRLQERKIHTAIETCGFCKWEIFERIISHVLLRI